MKRLFISITALIVLLALPAGAHAATYAALGDSVASGAGLPHAANASAEDILCDRSPNAYAYQIASAKNMDLMHAACSGAKVDEGLYGSQEIGDLSLTPQLDTAFANGTPDLISITIGANDMRWVSMLRDCYTWRCGSPLDNARLHIYKADLKYELYRTLSEISQRSNGTPPKVLLSGYYKPFNANNLTCSDARYISQKEVAWLDRWADELNSAIQGASEWFTFASFVPVDFSGHELCSADPWIQSRGDVAAFHPTTAGQAAIAEDFLRY